MKKYFASIGLVLMLALALSTTASAATTTTTLHVRVTSGFNMVRSKAGSYPIGHMFRVTTETTSGALIPLATVTAILYYDNGSSNVVRFTTDVHGVGTVSGSYGLNELCITSITKTGYTWADQDIPYCTIWSQ